MAAVKLNFRYELKEPPLGEGGMGVVYRAYDSLTGRDVALKTIKDFTDLAALDLFRKECDVQKSINHPNIVDIYDLGEFEQVGTRKPYFVMPLLRGMTLDKLIRSSSHRLTVERSVEIVAQVCRGLHAAHDRGLIHRDLKPSNIFVLEDDSVKIIDFGVAHLVDQRSSLGVKGTLLYMSPEQIQMKTPTALSDIFSLAVVCYETFTRRHPFARATRDEIAQAILTYTPPPASEINPAVSPALSQVVHAAMAKQPWHRFSTAREFSDALQKALRNESIDRFNPDRIQTRIERARTALDDGEYEFAAEILTELQSEGYLHPEIAPLRRQIDQAIREKTRRQLLESARKRFKDEEYQLALQKVQEILELDSQNPDALELQANIESKRSSQQIESWFRLARQHMENNAYSHARQALQNVLQLKPNDSRANHLLAEVGLREQEYLRVREEKERLYQAALEARRKGDVSSALTKLERVLEIDRNAPDTADPERGARYQDLYNQVRSEHDAFKNAYAEARSQLEASQFAQALEICNSYLEKFPGHALFQSLKFDVEERQRQELSAYVARIDREVGNEPDLERRVSILSEAYERQPIEHFKQSLQLTRSKRDLVNSIVTKARNLEERGQFSDALGQWEILRTIYGQYPGLGFETERLVKRRDQQARSEAKARWAGQIDQAVALGDFAKALNLTQSALAEFPNDQQLAALERQARQGLERSTEAQALLEEGRQDCTEKRFQEGLDKLRRAHELDDRNSVIRATLVENLLAHARSLLDGDWRAAEPFCEQAYDLEPTNPLAKSIRLMLADRKGAELVDECLAQAREAQAAGDLEKALSCVGRGLAAIAQEPRLLQLQETLKNILGSGQKAQARRKDLDELRAALDHETQSLAGRDALRSMFEQTRVIAKQYQDDAEFQSIYSDLERRVKSLDSQDAPPQTKGSPEALVDDVARIPSWRTRLWLPVVAAVRRIPDLAKHKPLLLARATARLRGTGVPLRYWGVGALVVLLIVVVSLLSTSKPPPSGNATKIQARILVSPPEARVRVNGQPVDVTQLLSLAPGKNTIEATMDGYEPKSLPVTVTAVDHGPYELELRPFLVDVRIATDLKSGTVTLDDQGPMELQDGQLFLEKLKLGTHTISVSAGRYGQAVIPFDTSAGTLPNVPGFTAKDLRGVLVSSFRGSGRLYCTCAPIKVAIDGQPAVDLVSDGLALPNLNPGPHELVFGDGKDQSELWVDIGANLALYVSLLAGSNVGSLEIASNEGAFQVFLNDRLRRVLPRGKNFIVTNVDPKQYTVRLEKEGFTVDPDKQLVSIRKGETKQVAFTFHEVPQVSTLRIHGAMPGTQVSVDGAQRATIETDGVTIADLAPGNHTIRLEKKGYHAKALSKSFGAAGVDLAGDEVTLQVAMGTLRFDKVEPPKTAMKIEQEAVYGEKYKGEANISAIPDHLDLPAGRYQLTFSAPGYESETYSDVETGDGSETPIPVSLKPAPKPRVVEPPAPGGMAEWENAGAWKADGAWFKRVGGGFVLYRRMPPVGLFSFTVEAPSGNFVHSERMQWFCNYRDYKNYTLFTFDRKHFNSVQMINGVPQAESNKKVDHKLDSKTQCTIQVEISPDRITHTVVVDGKSRLIHELHGSGLDQGRFGFFIPPGAEVRIKDFHFHPR